MREWSIAPWARRFIVMAGAAWPRVASSRVATRRAARTKAVSRRELAMVGPIAVALAFGSACQDPECEAARLELARTWETLRDTATSRQQIPEGANLTAAEEQERIRVWTTIEDRAELMRSSFETSQVTWPSAEKARADLTEAFKPVAANDDPMTRGFAVTLNEADQKMASFRKTCR
jgi:hypothetical protein